MRKPLPAISLSLLVLLVSCASSDMVSSWTRPGMVSKAYNKILILGLINEPDRTVREKIETHIADDLRKLGYVAVCACEAFQPNTFYGLTEAQMLAQMEENSFDAVLTIVLLSKEKQKYQPGGVDHNPGNNHQLWDYYQSTYDRVYQSDKSIETTSYFWETNLYDLSDHGQVYSAQTRSFDPTTVNAMAHQFGLLVVKDMMRKDVLAKQSEKMKAF
ncbi:hypothetical protein LZZ85_18565 [Terrimonas sp. NA20]|uniref:Uncharacterized protein n=1 Tax=Terrimonas ginsenosidimutans TaxID=2908004 RepID=A0ABS9KVD7_9BACT|nr:hypothetical protein [Terrimonas ginsenosidimutans]MCG2616309.1 hypothetical protein [Terrimonas ginsenosidimutans]